MTRDRFKELGGGHIAADEDADRAVPADEPPDLTSPYIPHIPGFSPGISYGDDTGEMGARSGVNASADAGSPSAPESQPKEEPAHPPQGLGVGEGDRGYAHGGGLTGTPGRGKPKP